VLSGRPNENLHIDPFAARWHKPYVFYPSETLAAAVARQMGFRIARVWVWVGVAVVCAWIVGLNILVIFAMALLKRGFSINIVDHHGIGSKHANHLQQACEDLHNVHFHK
jgi:hypothetical protein